MAGVESRWRRTALEPGRQGAVLLLRPDAHGRADRAAANVLKRRPHRAVRRAHSAWLHERRSAVADCARWDALPPARRGREGPGHAIRCRGQLDNAPQEITRRRVTGFPLAPGRTLSIGSLRAG